MVEALTPESEAFHTTVELQLRGDPPVLRTIIFREPNRNAEPAKNLQNRDLPNAIALVLILFRACSAELSLFRVRSNKKQRCFVRTILNAKNESPGKNPICGLAAGRFLRLFLPPPASGREYLDVDVATIQPETVTINVDGSSVIDRGELQALAEKIAQKKHWRLADYQFRSSKRQKEADISNTFLLSPQRHRQMPSKSDAIRFVASINELWQPLMQDIKSARTAAEKRLDLLGLTLYAAWGQIKPWLEDERTGDWAVTIYCISPRAARRSMSAWLPVDWADEAERRSKAISKFLQSYRSELAVRNVVVRLHHYDSFPAVHGYRLGSGKIYMSLTQWSPKTRKLEYGAHPYEVIHPNDESPRANAYRAIFTNWLRRVASRHKP